MLSEAYVYGFPLVLDPGPVTGLPMCPDQPWNDGCRHARRCFVRTRVG